MEPMYYITTRVAGRSVSFMQPIDDLEFRHTVVIGWKDLLRGLLKRKLLVEVITGKVRKHTYFKENDEAGVNEHG